MSVAQHKKKDELFHDLEQHIILRMPPGPATALLHDIESGAMNLKDKLLVDLNQEKRRGQVRYGGQVFNGKLVDLPTITESLKTVDEGKTMYKIADISQMLIASLEDSDSSGEEMQKRSKDRDRKFHYPHGISMPLKNVRKKRYRKTMKKKYHEQPDIEKEVRQLFITDSQAVDVKWEVVVEDEKPSEPGRETTVSVPEQVLARGETTNEDARIAEKDLFGDIVSSSDGEDDNDVNVLDSAGEDADTTSAIGNTPTPQTEEQESSQLQARLDELELKLQSIRDRKLNIMMDLSVLDDLEEKKDLQLQHDNLVKEENVKQSEFEILSSMIK